MWEFFPFNTELYYVFFSFIIKLTAPARCDPPLNPTPGFPGSVDLI